MVPSIADIQATALAVPLERPTRQRSPHRTAVNTLLSAGLLRETTGKKRGRVYLATEIFAAIMPEEAQAAAAPSTEGAPA